MIKSLWMVLGLVPMSILLWTPWLVSVQFSVWMHLMEKFRPHVLGFNLSAAYIAILLLLTCWFWIWRFMRWIFHDEGPLPRFFWLLLILWLPATTIPTILVLCFCAWIACWVKASAPEEEE